MYIVCFRIKFKLTASGRVIELESDYRARVGLSSSNRNQIIYSNRIEFLTTRLEFRIESSSEIKIENRIGLKNKNREIEPENPIQLEISILRQLNNIIILFFQ